VGGLDTSLHLIQQIDGAVERIVERVLGRLSIREMLGPLMIPRTPVADPSLAEPSAASLCPRIPHWGPVERKRKRKQKKKKGSTTPALEYFGCPQGGQEQQQVKMREVEEEVGPVGLLWAMVVGKRSGPSRIRARSLRQPGGPAGEPVAGHVGGGGLSAPRLGVGGSPSLPRSPSRSPTVRTPRCCVGRGKAWAPKN